MALWYYSKGLFDIKCPLYHEISQRNVDRIACDINVRKHTRAYTRLFERDSAARQKIAFDKIKQKFSKKLALYT